MNYPIATAPSINSERLEKAIPGIIEFLNEFGGYITVAIMFSVVTLVILFIISATKLSKSGDNPIKRQQAISALLVVGVCLALMGSFSLLFSILVSFLS